MKRQSRCIEKRSSKSPIRKLVATLWNPQGHYPYVHEHLLRMGRSFDQKSMEDYKKLRNEERIK
ncbi:hypothetical protein [Salibacterium aidingense]|uniref:hypothetical protein n=1 Tax=Salibacterium aidingense TaxID=384933 RepID=UPI00047D2468|nr:hypothetical protein [Salibacterium aidingense]